MNTVNYNICFDELSAYEYEQINPIRRLLIMNNTNLFFENLSDEQTIDLNGGSVLGIVIKIIGGIISVHGIYETGKDHIYEYNYNKAYEAEMKRLSQSNISSSNGGGSGTKYLQAR